RFLVVARPLERLAAAPQLALVGLVGVLDTARAQTLQRAFGALAAVHPRRTEEDDGVLNFLLLKSAQRLEVLREDPDRPRLWTVEKLLIQVGQRLLRHSRQFIIRCYDPPLAEELRSHEVRYVCARDRLAVGPGVRCSTAAAAVGAAGAARQAAAPSRDQERDGDLRQRQAA